MEEDQILFERLADLQNEPSNHERYKQQLLDAFPGEFPSGDLFFPDYSFDGSDEVDYLRSRGLFQDKKWFDVDFDQLYKSYIYFPCLTEAGDIYYLPTFLSYFWDLRHIDLEFGSHLMGYIDGSKFERELGSKESRIKYDYKKFESLTVEQAKLVATFLVNVANLIPSYAYDSQQAQKALTNYWGKFLISSPE